MPQPLTYPGVYIEELSSGVHTITGVATSIAAFVGYTKSGLDHRAKRIFSFGDFERSFGGLDEDSELSYAVQQFFQNGGTDAYVVRVPKSGAQPAKVVLQKVSGGATALEVNLLSTGTWSDKVIIDVDYDDVSDGTSFNLTITDLSTGVSESFRNVTMQSNKSNFVDAVVNDSDNGSNLVSIKASGSEQPAQTGAVGGPVDFKTKFNDPTKTYALKINSDFPGVPPQINGVVINFLNPGEAVPTSVLSLCQLLERKANQAIQQQIPTATIRCVPNKDKTGIRVSAFIPNAYDAVLSFSDTSLPAGAVSADAGLNLKAAVSNVSHYWPNSRRGNPADKTAATAVAAQTGAVRGFDGTALPQTADIIDPAQAKGIYALDKVDLFNILCIPDATRAQIGNPNLADLPAGDQNAIFSTALNYCKTRRAFLLVDPPPNVKDVDNATTWISSGLTVRDPYGNAAAYFPRLRLPDPLNDFQLRTFAPCGVVAGLYARIDATRGVWKAPAGVEASLNGVQSLVYKLTDGENGALNPLGLNCFRNFPVYGPVCWGARTIAGADAQASEWKYLSVRRVALFLEETLYRGTKWVVFEPNDEPLWAQIRLNIGAFMHNLFRQGAFQGKTPREAYFVKCDKETTTQNDINLGIVNIVVGFAPLKPAEFVVIKLQQMAGQIET